MRSRSRSASRFTRSRLRRNCGSCGGQELEPGDGPLTEIVDEAAVTEDAVDFPMRRHRAQIHELHVPNRGQLRDFFFAHGHSGEATGSPPTPPRPSGAYRLRPPGAQ